MRRSPPRGSDGLGWPFPAGAVAPRGSSPFPVHRLLTFQPAGAARPP
jgi:hypothetical protein